MVSHGEIDAGICGLDACRDKHKEVEYLVFFGGQLKYER